MYAGCVRAVRVEESSTLVQKKKSGQAGRTVNAGAHFLGCRVAGRIISSRQSRKDSVAWETGRDERARCLPSGRYVVEGPQLARDERTGVGLGVEGLWSRKTDRGATRARGDRKSLVRLQDCCHRYLADELQGTRTSIVCVRNAYPIRGRRGCASSTCDFIPGRGSSVYWE